MRTALALSAVAVALVVTGLIVWRGFFGGVVLAQSTRPAIKTTALQHTVKDIDGNDFDLRQLKGKVVLVVNVASRCGFTKQYAGLEKLYKDRKDAGLVILAFPANDFGSQEPGTDAEIKDFCTTNFGVTFPVMSKITVKGEAKHPVYRALTENTGEFAGEVRWNFTKFLLARDGETLLARFGSNVAPDDEKLLTTLDAALKQ